MKDPATAPKPQAGEPTARRLSPAELGKLAERLVAATDPSEVDRIKKEMERGFYGDPVRA